MFDRGGLAWAFNFHPTQSFTDYQIGVPEAGTYKVVLDSDRSCFGGHNRVVQDTLYFSSAGSFNGRDHSIKIYLPCRTALVFCLVPRIPPTLKLYT